MTTLSCSAAKLARCTNAAKEGAPLARRAVRDHPVHALCVTSSAVLFLFSGNSGTTDTFLVASGSCRAILHIQAFTLRSQCASRVNVDGFNCIAFFSLGM